jgi:ribosomal protein S18 acetylase RimI-like enzyme
MRITFSPATDRGFLHAVYASTRVEELARVPWSAEQKAEFLRSQFEAQDHHYRTYYPQASFEVILIDGERAGRLYVARGADEIRIVDIALLPAFRGRGAGGEIVRGILAEAAEKKLPVRIHVEQFNPALRLYERLGFRKIEDKGVYFFLERPVT